MKLKPYTTGPGNGSGLFYSYLYSRTGPCLQTECYNKVASYIGHHGNGCMLLTRRQSLQADNAIYMGSIRPAD